MIDDRGRVPKKMAGAKKILRPSPPHSNKPPEVPFHHVGRPDNKKSHDYAWLCGNPAIMIKTLDDFVHPVRA
jgi:hypothetical protein